MSGWGLHPDFKLHLAFNKKAYQGCNIHEAEIVIIGKDANFPKELKLERKKRKIILDYLSKGSDFVNEKTVLHPFLLQSYNQKLFPKNFDFYNKLVQTLSANNISVESHNKISIIDILPMPTYGSSSTEQSAFLNYLKIKMDNVILIENLILARNKTIFIKNNAFNLLKTIININDNDFENLKGYKKLI